MKLSDWVDARYLKKEKQEELKEEFKKNKPFAHLELLDFFRVDKVFPLVKALSHERFYEKESDLFKFKQTEDFKDSEVEILKEFRAFLKSKEFVAFMQNATGLKLKIGTIDIAGTLYEDTDFLLCHDDQLEGRKIAFLYYVSNLEQRDGGKLHLYKSEKQKPVAIEKQIIPRFNTFAFFEVSKKSFHAVEEVEGHAQRIAIAGWFHGN